MGIPGFFMIISKNYNIAITNNISYVDIFVDFNSLIYTAKYIVFDILNNYFKYKLGLDYDLNSDFSKIKYTTLIDRLCKNYVEEISISDNDQLIDIRNEMIFDSIVELFKKIYKQTKNISSINIYLDGVPYIGKIIEQRKRALLSVLIAKGKELIIKNTKIDPITYFINIIIEPLINLDKTLIKPGTSFMIKLNNWLKTDFKDIIIDDVKTLSPDFTNWGFSGYEINGEAEHKIMDDIINKKYKNILVYSPDADMIILLLPLTTNIDIYLVRQDFLVYSINKLSKDIYDYIDKITEIEIDINRLILDISFIYNIFGNDFLPKLDNINIYDKTTIHRVFKQYGKYLDENNKYIINETNNIDW
jgi:5'-3' exonuclease